MTSPPTWRRQHPDIPCQMLPDQFSFPRASEVWHPRLPDVIVREVRWHDSTKEPRLRGLGSKSTIRATVDTAVGLGPDGLDTFSTSKASFGSGGTEQLVDRYRR